jgi:hypothetical protein
LNKILISNNNDFFSTNLKRILLEKFNDNVSISVLENELIEKNLPKEYFHNLIYSFSNDQFSFNLVNFIRTNFSYINLIVLGDNMNADTIKFLYKKGV